MIIILRDYQRKHGINTTSTIICRWAPTSENDTQVYIDSVSQELGVAPEQRIDISDSHILMKLLQAIIRNENSCQPYSFDVFVKAIDLVRC